jgi:hypothetical protein
MLLDDVKTAVGAIPANLVEKNGLYSFEFTLAERKAFLSTKKLAYRASFRIDDAARELRFTEMLKETGSGMATGDGVSPGFGFKVETYKTGFGQPRQGGIAEQSDYFGKQYKYNFDYSAIRRQFEAAAVRSDYRFIYLITPVGL